MSRQVNDLQGQTTQIEGIPLPCRFQLPGSQGKVCFQIKIHGHFRRIQLRHPHIPSVVLHGQLHIQRMDVCAAELLIAAGVIHMTVGIDHIEGLVRDAAHHIPQASEAVACVEEQCVVCAHHQIHINHAVADAPDAGLQLRDRVNRFFSRHGYASFFNSIA